MSRGDLEREDLVMLIGHVIFGLSQSSQLPEMLASLKRTISYSVDSDDTEFFLVFSPTSQESCLPFVAAPAPWA
jgi:hypothetical protein